MTSQLVVVDDDPDIGMLVRLSVAQISELEFTYHCDPQGALGALKQSLPAVLLLDVMMPGLSGPQLLKKLREHWGEEIEQAQIVFLTAKAQREELAQLAALGPAAVWTKPFSPMALARDISALLTD